MGNSMGSLRSSTGTQAGAKGASGDKGEAGRPGERGEKVSQRAAAHMCVCIINCALVCVCVGAHNNNFCSIDYSIDFQPKKAARTKGSTD